MRAFLVRKEGLRLRSYKCSAGIWTVGVGCTGFDIGPNTVWTETYAMQRFDEALLRREQAVERLVKVPLSDRQFGALVSLVYNIGVGNFEKSTLLKKLNAGGYAPAGEEFMRWVFAGGRVVDGLRVRRSEEKALFLSGA